MIKIIKNILTNKERKQLIEYSKPLLLTGEELNRHAVARIEDSYPPSKQTLSDLHRNDKFIPIIIKILNQIESETKLKVIPDKVWINWNSGKKEEHEGKMLFFPSSMGHEVFPFYDTDEQRVSMSGNIFFSPPTKNEWLT